MSDNILKIVPRDPLFRPSEEAEMAVKRLLKEMIPRHDTLEAKRHDSVVFVDCGENHERTTCPRCGADLGQHWHQWMNDSYRRSGFRDREVVVPCCGATVDLNDLLYYFPMGFASWFIELWNPDPAAFVSAQNESRHRSFVGKSCSSGSGPNLSTLLPSWPVGQQSGSNAISWEASMHNEGSEKRGY
jgi:hypothetical protein